MEPASAAVVVVGSVNQDLVFTVARLPAPGETVGGAGFVELGGGKGANTAASAATMTPTYLIAAVGDDDAGRAATSELESLGVSCEFVQILSGEPTGRAGILTGPDSNVIAVAPGANAAIDVHDITTALMSVAERHPAAVCLVNGELDDDAVNAAIVAATEAGLRVAYNVSPARPLTAAAAACRPIIVVNEIEIAQLAQAMGRATTSDPVACAQALVGEFDRVVVTLGPDGVVAARDGELLTRPADPTEVVDTVGAGDAFFGSFGAAFASGATLDDAVTAGMRAAALAVASVGARGWLARR